MFWASKSVLSNLHLEDRLLVDYTLDSHVVSPIDWEKVESSLNGKIEDSYNFLKNSLNVETIIIVSFVLMVQILCLVDRVWKGWMGKYLEIKRKCLSLR